MFSLIGNVNIKDTKWKILIPNKLNSTIIFQNFYYYSFIYKEKEKTNL